MLASVKEILRPYWIWAQPSLAVECRVQKAWVLMTSEKHSWRRFIAFFGHAKWKLNKITKNKSSVANKLHITSLLVVKLSKIYIPRVCSFPCGKISLYVITGVKPSRPGHDRQHGVEVGFSTMATAETRNVSTSFEFCPNFNNKKIMCCRK